MFPAICYVAAGLALTAAVSLAAAKPASPLYVYCGTGDHYWVWEREPVDSPATIAAMFDWMARSYGVTRMYWRGGQEDIWGEDYQVSQVLPQAYDGWMWGQHLYQRVKVNELAVRAARRHHMEIFLHTGLFEHGVQPDIGIICPYPFEDRLRIEHPEWCPRDRWNERRCPGPLSFAYPEVRRLLVDRYVRHVTQHGYDGLSFYTYVENVGVRYEDEFGFEPPVIQEFQRLHPDTDPTRDALTDQQRLDLHRCRGQFVTEFLRELHAGLRAHGKQLAVIVDSKDPSNVQPWWGHPIAANGRILMDWETWAKEGIVDELYVQLGEVADQQATLDRLLAACAGTPVKLTVRATHPLQEPSWAPYVQRGVTPISCITSPVNDIERYTLEPTSAETLGHRDWRLRAQTLMDVAADKLQVEAPAAAAATRDPHVLVRRQALFALAKLQDAGQVGAIEAALRDKEPSVRAAVAVALSKLHGPDSARRILEALNHNHDFLMKEVCVTTLGALGEDGLRAATEGLEKGAQPVREVCVRALYDLGKTGYAGRAYELLRPVSLDRDEDEVVRYWAVYGLLGSRLRVSAPQAEQSATDFTSLIADEPSLVVQLQLAYTLGYMPEFMSAPLRQQALDVLVGLFREYGDGSRRADAAYGWRLVGNALHQFGEPGDRALEQMRSQREDKWLAWIAYEVAHVPQRGSAIVLTTEREAVATHAKYAPEFPGYRPW